MSVTTSQWRNDSGEIDVFEAARYFSGGGGNEIPSSNQRIIREERQHSERSAARMSLDMPLPMIKHAMLTQNQHQNKKQMKENNNSKIKYKQPSSPGGKLASFLNSLFNQTNSKKNKKKSKPDGAKLDHHLEEENTRRRRRSSISHFEVTISDHNNSKSSSSATSGFRTPPPYADTPNKSYKDYQKVISLPKKGGSYIKPTLQNHELYIEKFRFKNSEEKDEFRKFSDDADDHADSDSSSDLFDLPNHDLDFYPSGLPVYETTHMDKIKIGAPISNATATA